MIRLINSKRLLISASFCVFDQLCFNDSLHPQCCHPGLTELVQLLSRIYQFSKRHALEECRQQVALSQGIRARLEVQRVLLKEKLDQLGTKEPVSSLNQDLEASSLLSVAGSAHVSEGGLVGGACKHWFP